MFTQAGSRGSRAVLQAARKEAPRPTEAGRMKHLDLFSGIGGFSLAARRVGWETVGFCEIDPYCQKVLAKHWPGVPVYDDITRLSGEQVRPIDIVTGGFPCQDISLTGNGRGLAGERSGLWRELHRIIGELRPRFAVMENVSALLSRGLGEILGDLAEIGYDAEWHCIPASYAGARSLRDRIWIVAYPERYSIQGRANVASAWCQKSREEQLAGLVQPCAWPTISESRDRGAGNGVPYRVHRNRAIGNAIVPQVAELIFRAINSVVGERA